MIDYTDDPDNDDRESERIVNEQPQRVSEARAAMARGDAVAAGWWFYGVGPAGTQPWPTDPKSVMKRFASSSRFAT